MSEPAVRQPIWKNLWPRLFSALAMAAILIIPFYFGGAFWAVTIFLLGVMAIWEWVGMTDKPATPTVFILGAGLTAAIVTQFMGYGHWLYGIIFAAAGAAFLERLTRKGGEKIWAPFGALYIILPCVAAILLRGNETGIETAGFKLLSYVFLVVIAADVGAYFGGSFFKGPKLAPRLSPKKTWSGLCSGIVFGILFGAMASLFLKMDPMTAGLIAIPIVLISVVGDFFESSIKRRMNVKDAGSILPGHGGVLDRLDSILMVMIAAHFLAYFYDYSRLI